MPGSPLLGTEAKPGVFVMREPLARRDRADLAKILLGIVYRVSRRGVRGWERCWREGCCRLEFLSDPCLLLLAADS